MLNLVILLSVILKLLFFFNLSINKGNIDPLLCKTFPYLKTEKHKSFLPTILFAEVNNLSAQSLVAPYKLTGEEALSVERAKTFFTELSRQASIKLFDPIILVLINSKGLYSAVSTCFNAAA